MFAFLFKEKPTRTPTEKPTEGKEGLPVFANELIASDELVNFLMVIPLLRYSAIRSSDHANIMATDLV